MVVNLDNHPEKGKVSGVDYWKDKGLPFDTLTVKTPRDGLHLYFLASPEQIRRLEENCSHNFDNCAIDLFYSSRYYVCAPGTIVGGKEYTITNWTEPVAFPDRVVDLYLLERALKRGKTVCIKYYQFFTKHIYCGNCFIGNLF